MGRTDKTRLFTMRLANGELKLKLLIQLNFPISRLALPLNKFTRLTFSSIGQSMSTPGLKPLCYVFPSLVGKHVTTELSPDCKRS